MGITSSSLLFHTKRSNINTVGRDDGLEYVLSYAGDGTGTNVDIRGGFSGSKYGYDKLYSPLGLETVSQLHPGQVVYLAVNPSGYGSSGYEYQMVYTKFYQGGTFINSGHMLLAGERGSYEWDGQQFYKRKRLHREYLLPRTANDVSLVASYSNTTATSGHKYQYLSFTGTGSSVGEWQIPMAEGWDKGNIRVIIHYAGATAPGANQAVRWEIDAFVVNDNDVLAQAPFTAQKIILDPITTGDANKMMKTLRTEEFAPRNIGASWSPSNGTPLLHVSIRRDAGNVADTYGATAMLFGVSVEYYLDKWW